MSKYINKDKDDGLQKKYPVGCEIIINNNILKQVSHFYYFDCRFSYLHSVEIRRTNKQKLSNTL
jgi:hypothetical protein